MAMAPSAGASDRSARPTDLLFVDGLRAVAALSVACLHAFLYTGAAGSAERELPLLAHVFLFGQYGVAVFIVVSGFVLSLPVASHPALALRGGTRAFMRRRARRILPPYYAALLGFTVLILAIPGLEERSGTAWDSKVPVTTGDVLAHAGLVHNLGASAFKIDGPLWTVATEWQIYFLLPLLLIPLWRRLGAASATGLGLAIGVGLHFASPRFDVAHAWYLGLFAFGMLAAAAVNGGRPALQLDRLRFASVAAVLGVFAAAVLNRDFTDAHQWLVEPALGAGVACGLVVLTAQVRAGRPGSVLRLLSSRPLVAVGLFSYSLYLVHSPLIGWFNLATDEIEVPTLVRLALMLVIALPLAVLAAYAFFLAVERRFMSGHMRDAAAAAPGESRPG